MSRRPMCLMCLLLIGLLFLADRAGFPLIRGNPVPASVQGFIRAHPQNAVIGEVQRCVDTELSQSVYLKDTILYLSQSEKSNKSYEIPIYEVRAFLKEETQVPVGALVLLSGKLEEVKAPGNPGEFDSRQYNACDHMYYQLKNAKIQKISKTHSPYGQAMAFLREKAAEIFNEAAGEDGPLFSSVVLGDKRELDPEIKMRYQMAGIIHFLAISGLHISILGMGVYNLLWKTGTGIWIAGLVGLAVMVQYGILIGSSVSAIRALVMFLLMVVGKITGRIYDMPTALGLSALLILLESPAYLYSSSFLLSFGAVMGIGIVVPAVQDFFEIKSPLAKGFLGSVCVQLTTLPVLLWSYGEASVLGCVLNLVVLPTAGAVLVSGVVVLIFGGWWMGAACAAAAPGRMLLKIYEWLCILAAKAPFCTWIGGCPRGWQVVIYYVGFMGILVWMSRSKKRGWLSCLLPVGAVILLVSVLGLRFPEGLSITCLDVGQGDCIAVETPGGEHFLIDGGSSNEKKMGLYKLLPYLKHQGISYVEGIFVSHTDEDHISGILELLEYQNKRLTSIKVGTLFLPDWTKPPGEWEQLKQLAEASGTKVERVREGMRWKLGDVSIKALAPKTGASGKDVNEEGMALQLEYGDFRGLFTGDMGEEREKELLEQLEDVDFLKVGHHGSKHSSSEIFLEKIRPEIAVISCSKTNTYGHPAPETVERLEEQNSRIFYTMNSGAVRVKTDGQRIWVEEYRGGEM